MITKLHDSGLLLGLSPAEAAELAGRFSARLVARREPVFAEAAPGDALYVVLSGKLKVFLRAPDGREAVLAVAGPGEVVGEWAAVDGGRHRASASALVTTRLAWISGTELRAWVLAHPSTAEVMLKLLARRLRRATEAVTSAASTDAGGRLAGQLLELGARFGRAEQGRARLTHDLSQEELGQLVGTTRETVNRTLGEFARRGWIRLDGRSVVLLQPVRLARRAGLPETAAAAGRGLALAG